MVRSITLVLFLSILTSACDRNNNDHNDDESSSTNTEVNATVSTTATTNSSTEYTPETDTSTPVEANPDTATPTPAPTNSETVDTPESAKEPTEQVTEEPIAEKPSTPTDIADQENPRTVQFKATLTGLYEEASLLLTVSDQDKTIYTQSLLQQSDEQTISLDSFEQGSYNIGFEQIPEGYECNLNIADEFSISESTVDESTAGTLSNDVIVEINCNDNAIKQLLVDVNLTPGANLSGAMLTIEGIVSDEIGIDAALLNIEIQSDRVETNGKTDIIQPASLARFSVENRTTTFQSTSIATNLKTEDNPSETFVTDQAGNLVISYDSRLLNENNRSNLPLLIATFSCPSDSLTITTAEPESIDANSTPDSESPEPIFPTPLIESTTPTQPTSSTSTSAGITPISIIDDPTRQSIIEPIPGEKTCGLSYPIRVVLTPEQFESGQWTGNQLTEMVYRQLRYYLLAGYSIAEMSAYMDSLANHLLLSESNSKTYQDLLSWRNGDDQSQTARRHDRLVEIGSLLLRPKNTFITSQLEEQSLNLMSAHYTDFNTPGNATALAVLDNTAYLADGRSGLQIIDISNKDDPVILGSFQANDLVNVTDISVDDSFAYLIDQRFGLQIVDLGTCTK